MPEEVADSIGRAFRRQRDAVDDSRMAVWRGLIVHREVDEALLSVLEAESQAVRSGVEITVAVLQASVGGVETATPADTRDGGSTSSSALEGPLDGVTEATEVTTEYLVEAVEGGLTRFEDALRETVLTVNRRINTLLDAHEALQERLQEEIEGREGESSETLYRLCQRLSELHERVLTLRERVQRLRARLEDGSGDVR
ncbi:MAG: hypothetical protein ABEJ30_02625 [Halorientalis sp.]